MYTVPEEETGYGLSLLRRSISEYEVIHAVSPDESKQKIPFFRNLRKLLIGPEMEMYTHSFFETPELPHDLPMAEGPLLSITFDSEKLTAYCLAENLYLLRCKYDEEKNLQTFAGQMEREYPKFFYDEEHTGFTADSRLFSMLCNACLEVRSPRYSNEKEWRMVRFCQPEDASYQFEDNRLFPFTSVSVPLSAIRRIKLLEQEKHAITYSALAGFLQRVGLAPGQYLDGLIDTD